MGGGTWHGGATGGDVGMDARATTWGRYGGAGNDGVRAWRSVGGVGGAGSGDAGCSGRQRGSEVAMSVWWRWICGTRAEHGAIK